MEMEMILLEAMETKIQWQLMKGQIWLFTLWWGVLLQIGVHWLTLRTISNLLNICLLTNLACMSWWLGSCWVWSVEGLTEYQWRATTRDMMLALDPHTNNCPIILAYCHLNYFLNILWGNKRKGMEICQPQHTRDAVKCWWFISIGILNIPVVMSSGKNGALLCAMRRKVSFLILSSFITHQLFHSIFTYLSDTKNESRLQGQPQLGKKEMVERLTRWCVNYFFRVKILIIVLHIIFSYLSAILCIVQKCCWLSSWKHFLDKWCTWF